MLKVLNDIKNELAEQKQQARDKQLDANGGDKPSISRGSGYTDESLGGSEISLVQPVEFEDHQRPVPKCTVLHYSPFKAVWDWIVLLLVLYTAVFTPYIVAFQIHETDVRMNLNDDQMTRLKNANYIIEDPLVFVDLLVDMMFIVDIIIAFRTTFVVGGEVVTNSKRIAVHYMKGWFVIDAIAAIPFDLLFFGSGTSDTLTITGALKLVRLFRLLRVVRRADQYSQYATATLLLMLISFGMIAHWLACIFYIIAYAERKTLTEPISWLDALAVQMETPYLTNDTTSGPDIKSRYITALYFTMTTLTSIGFGNVAPNTKYEKVFSIVAMMIGALMSAAIFGNFSSIMMRMYQGSEEMQQKTRSIKDFISFHNIPESLSKRMHDAFLHSWSDTNGIDMNSVLKSFPEQIQADICLLLNKNLLNNNDAFKGASPGCLRALSLRFTTTHAPPGDNLIHFGDIVNAIYFVARGSIEILQGEECIAILGRGDIFGLSVNDLTSVVKSNYNVHALTFCDMNKIDAYDLQDIFDMYPEFTENFKKKFCLTFNLKLGEYTRLVKPQAMDEETIKLIRQKRPKMQYLLGTADASIRPAFCEEETTPHVRDGRRVLESKGSVDEPGGSTSIIELTPSGHGAWTSYDSAGGVKHHSRRNSEHRPAKKVTIQAKGPEEFREENKEKHTFRSIMLLAAKIQKQKDAEEAAAAVPVVLSPPGNISIADSDTQQAASQKEKNKTDFAGVGAELAVTPLAPGCRTGRHMDDTCHSNKHFDDTCHSNRHFDDTCHISEDEMMEKERLRNLSDRIDECMLRAARVEQLWNTSVQSIFKLLGHDPDTEKKSYV